MSWAVIVGVGPGLGAALARRFAREGLRVVLAARTPERLDAVVAEVGPLAMPHACDATDEDAVRALFARLDGPPEIVVFNASGRVRKPLLEIEVSEFERAWRNACLGGFLVGREAARAMLAGRAQGSGTILFTGATASVKAYAGSAGFAVGKFGLRALAQSMAREFGPKGLHVGHVIVDGGIRGPHHAPDPQQPAEHLLEPDAIADAYWAMHKQPRSAWTQEIDIRPWVETF